MTDDRNTECKILRAHAKRKAADDVSARHLMMIRSQLTEETL